MFCLLAGWAAAQQASADLNYVVNGGFENGLSNWKVEGQVDVVHDSALKGKSSIRFGAGKSSVHQRYEIPGLRIVLFQARGKALSDGASGLIRARCFDSKGRKLMEDSQVFDPKKIRDAKGVEAGVYFKTHAYTSYVELSIEGTGGLVADSVVLNDDDKNRVEHATQCNLDQYMKPIWEGKTVYNETVLMFSEHGGPARGRLMYSPDRILSVSDTTLHHRYEEGKDFSRSGKDLVVTPGSAMTVAKDSEIPKGDFPWLSVAGRHAVVTYSHSDSWQGPRPEAQSDLLPLTVGKLRAQKPVSIAAFGDSITLGINVSGYRNEPPYMPTWVDLLGFGLRKSYGYSNIKTVNVGLGGMTASWGELNAKDSVGSLKPDLVLIAFGMNDFWSVEPPEFKASILAIMKSVREKSPLAEFVLITSIRFDPDYTKDPTYVGHMTGYAEALRSLRGPGVAVFDMTAMSEALYKAKSAKDLMTDPMHPDDFLARWYAQGLVTTLGGRIQ